MNKVEAIKYLDHQLKLLEKCKIEEYTARLQVMYSYLEEHGIALRDIKTIIDAIIIQKIQDLIKKFKEDCDK